MNKPFAIIIHLFYTDNWPLFKKKISLLSDVDFGLFITMPKTNRFFEETIYADFPKATIIYTKNRGRDVLPFIKAGRMALSKGYEVALKFHSKKSTHRQDGQEWLETMLDEIIPDDLNAREQVLKVISTDNFGVLGPKNVYYPLTINFPANGKHLSWIITKFYNSATEHLFLQENRKEYGFFGGTMLWVNLKAIENLFSISSLRFEREKGQIDGTMAHAIERALCIIPQIENLSVYESDGRVVSKRSYKSDNIPDWSEDHDK